MIGQPHFVTVREHFDGAREFRVPIFGSIWICRTGTYSMFPHSFI
jgi:hypothetical protein